MWQWHSLYWSLLIFLGLLCFTIKPVLQYTIGG
jgi:lipid-A-disaccharide synthase-like uncharacterized protein